MSSATAKRKNALKNGVSHASFKFGGIDIDVVEYASRGNAILGIRDSGKTYTATAIGEHLMTNGVPIIVFDPVGVWRFLRVPGAGKGFPVVVAGGMAGDLPLTVATAPDVVRAAMKAGVSLVIDLFSKDFSKMDWKRIVTDCVEVLIYENQEYGLRHVFIEEAAEFVPQRIGRDTAKVYSAMEKLARVGGNSRLGYTLINQRAEEVNKAVLELCDNLFLHRQKGRNSLKSLSKWLDVGNVENVKPIMETMATLPTGECWVWLKDHDDVKRIKVPKKKSAHPDRRMMHGSAASIAKKSVDVGKFVMNMKKLLEKPAPIAAKGKAGKAVTAPPIAKGYTAAQLEAEHAKGFKLGGDAAKKQADVALEAQRKENMTAGDAAVAAFKEFDKHFHRVRAAIEAVQHTAKLPIKNYTFKFTEKPGRIVPPPAVAAALAAPKSQTVIMPSAMQGGDESLTGPQRTMLRALAWWMHMGKDQPTRTQVAVICKWRTTGSNLKDRISDLFRMGLIAKPTSKTIMLTDAGARAAPAPDLSQSLVESIRAILTGPQDAFFMQLPADGSEITRANIALALGWNPDGSNLKDRISDLNRLDIIIKPSKETVARADWIRE